MAEVDGNVYGLFVECVEDVTVGGTSQTEIEDNEAWASSLSFGKRKIKSSMFGKFIKAMEKVNLPLAESTDSLSSFASALSAHSSSQHLSDVNMNTLTPELFLEAVESLTLNNYGSTNSLHSFSNDMNKSMSIRSDSLSVIQFFFKALEQFINTKSDDEEISADAEFPKLC